MPFDNAVSALRNIADAIDGIQQFTEGMDFEAFREDLKTIAAVERKLLARLSSLLRLWSHLGGTSDSFSRDGPPDYADLRHFVLSADACVVARCDREQGGLQSGMDDAARAAGNDTSAVIRRGSKTAAGFEATVNKSTTRKRR